MNAVRFKFRFDQSKMVQELASISSSFQTITSNSTTDNKLRGMHLINAQIAAEEKEGSTYEHSSELEQCPYLQSVLNSFDCDKFNFRVHNLTAGGKITLHKDHGKSLIDGVVRIHIPVTTNEEVYFFVDGERVQMSNGECWLADIGKPHEVENRSNEDRYQLMIDCYLNDWWKQVLKEHNVELPKPSKWAGFALTDLQTIKANLIRPGVEIDKDSIAELEAAIALLA